MVLFKKTKQKQYYTLVTCLKMFGKLTSVAMIHSSFSSDIIKTDWYFDSLHVDSGHFSKVSLKIISKISHKLNRPVY